MRFILVAEAVEGGFCRFARQPPGTPQSGLSCGSVRNELTYVDASHVKIKKKFLKQVSSKKRVIKRFFFLRYQFRILIPHFSTEQIYKLIWIKEIALNRGSAI